MDLRLGDCLEVMKTLPHASVDAIVCDPPYGLEFMGKEWDNLSAVNRSNRGTLTNMVTASGKPKFQTKAPAFDLSAESQSAMQAWHTAWCTEAFRVLKPGGHLLAFGGTRTYHRLACAVEDAGFEIRDSVIWCYGSGFPKSLDVSKALDKSAGAVREVVGYDASRARPNRLYEGGALGNIGATGTGKVSDRTDNGATITAPATDAAKTWEGWGTALKPAFEPVVVGRKPLAGTVAENVLKHGTGALNIAATRIPFASAADEKESKDKNQHEDFGTAPLTGNVTYGDYSMVQPKNYNPPGRWPSNLLLAHSPSCVHLDTADDTDLWACVPGCPIRALDAQSGTGKTVEGASRSFMRFDPNDAPFLYQAKANKKERNAGVEGGNKHPTVKPVSVMAYLCRLVTPPGGVVLDPFMGSGSTGVAALREGFRFIGIEREAEYFDIAQQRIEHARKNA